MWRAALAVFVVALVAVACRGYSAPLAPAYHRINETLDRA